MCTYLQSSVLTRDWTII